MPRASLRNPDEVDPDSDARLGNLDGVAPDGSLDHAHVDGHPCDVPSSLDIPHPEFWLGNVPPSPDISHLADISRWERKAFQLPRLDISKSANSVYPESFTAILHSAAVFS